MLGIETKGPSKKKQKPGEEEIDVEAFSEQQVAAALDVGKKGYSVTACRSNNNT